MRKKNEEKIAHKNFHNYANAYHRGGDCVYYLKHVHVERVRTKTPATTTTTTKTGNKRKCII